MKMATGREEAYKTSVSSTYSDGVNRYLHKESIGAKLKCNGIPDFLNTTLVELVDTLDLDNAGHPQRTSRSRRVPAVLKIKRSCEEPVETTLVDARRRQHHWINATGVSREEVAGRCTYKSLILY